MGDCHEVGVVGLVKCPRGNDFGDVDHGLIVAARRSFLALMKTELRQSLLRPRRAQARHLQSLLLQRGRNGIVTRRNSFWKAVVVHSGRLGNMHRSLMPLDHKVVC